MKRKGFQVSGAPTVTMTTGSVYGARCIPRKETNFKARGAHTPTHGLTSTSRIRTASHTTRAVAAMDSCFALIGQAVGWCMCAP